MATARILLDPRHPQSDGSAYVKVRVTDERVSRYYPCNHNIFSTGKKIIADTVNLDRTFTKKEFDQIMSGKRRNSLQTDYSIAFNAFQNKADEIINSLKLFSFDMFAELWGKRKAMKGTLAGLYEDKINTLEASNKIAYALIHTNAKDTFEKYKPGSKLSDITVKWLKGFDDHTKENGIGITAKAMYLRTLRTILNECITLGQYEPALYPFRKKLNEVNKYAIPDPIRNPRAVPANEIQILLNYHSPVRSLQQARDFWVLSYLANGMNIRDILNLKWFNKDGDYITYVRQKTKKENDPIRVHLKPEALRIISAYGVPSTTPDNFIFPFLNNQMDPKESYEACSSFINNFNKSLKKIAKELKVKYTTSYGARHSMANTLKQNKVPYEVIKEIMNHADLKTTELYLDSFHDDTLKDATDILMNPTGKVVAG